LLRLLKRPNSRAFALETTASFLTLPVLCIPWPMKFARDREDLGTRMQTSMIARNSNSAPLPPLAQGWFKTMIIVSQANIRGNCSFAIDVILIWLIFKTHVHGNYKSIALFTITILSAILCFWQMQMSELAHKSIESLFRFWSKQFCMSFIRSHLPGGEKSPTELLMWTRLNKRHLHVDGQLGSLLWQFWPDPGWS
jgi:hypothetical protein